jgi:flagellar assembly protein FliH
MAALSEVVELAVAVARRVTKRQGEIDPRVLEANLVEAMKLVVHAADVRIAVHPEQKAALLETLPRLKMQWPDLQHVELIEDANLSKGGCRVLTRNGEIDADLAGQLDRVVRELLPEAEGQ